MWNNTRSFQPPGGRSCAVFSIMSLNLNKIVIKAKVEDTDLTDDQ